MSRTTQEVATVPPPPPPGDPDAWYAPDVRAQYAVHPGVVATVTAVDGADAFTYATREATLGPADEAAFARIADRFDFGSITKLSTSV